MLFLAKINFHSTPYEINWLITEAQSQWTPKENFTHLTMYILKQAKPYEGQNRVEFQICSSS